MDPKTALSLAGVVALAVGGVAYRLGRRAKSGALNEELRQLQDDLVVAHSTPDPADDKAIEEKIKAKQRLKAAIDNLPDTL